MEQVITIVLDAQKELRQDIKDLNHKIDLILEWKWKLVGGTIVVSGVLTIFFQIGLSIVQNGR